MMHQRVDHQDNQLYSPLDIGDISDPNQQDPPPPQISLLGLLALLIFTLLTVFMLCEMILGPI